jgi:alcohol dehydrogenase (cytochrome c)
MRIAALLFCSVPILLAQGPGRAQFENRCAVCHGGDGNGGEHAPGILAKVTALNDPQLAAFIKDGLPARGMPAFNLTGEESSELIGYLRTLRPRRAGAGPTRVKVETTDGQTVQGLAINYPAAEDLQLRTADQQIRLMRKAGEKYRPVTSEADWPSYDGETRGHRFSKLTQINKENVKRLAPKWIFALPNASRLQGTPVVVGGIMYVTNANECYALDAGSGRQIWQFQRPRTKGLAGNAAGGMNRGVAVGGDRLFMVSDNAHLLALDRFSGKVLWETEMADWHQSYNATSAPLVVGDLVVSGTAGGEQGVRGFLAAYDQASGKEVWRFWTVPKPGEPGAETWIGRDIEHGGATTWLTGSYDPELGLVYWQSGNPGPDYNGDYRKGDNLYASSILALEAKTGKLKWYFQVTPHNVWDWDAQQPLALVEANWQGQPRKLLLQASRNGFFYVLDRTNGKLLLAKPFVKKLTWAKEIDVEGRPVLNPNQEPTEEGARICPSSHGAANYYSTSFSPVTGLYYLQTYEACNIFSKRPSEWQPMRGFMGGGSAPAADDTPQKVLRAIDIKTGKVAWELPQSGLGLSHGGTMTTASGLVFFCEDTDFLVAVDADSGKPLWRWASNNVWRASPMTYLFDGKQHVAIMSGANVVSFALME